MKKLAGITLFAAASMSAGQANAQASAFDLICIGRSDNPMHFRFNLTEGKWCFAKCAAVWGINDLADGAIKVLTYSTDGRNDWTIIFNRYTSTFSAERRGYGKAPADEGQCTARPFSGFPSRKF